jgi:hypothetical protein
VFGCVDEPNAALRIVQECLPAFDRAEDAPAFLFVAESRFVDSFHAGDRPHQRLAGMRIQVVQDEDPPALRVAARRVLDKPREIRVGSRLLHVVMDDLALHHIPRRGQAHGPVAGVLRFLLGGLVRFGRERCRAFFVGLQAGGLIDTHGMHAGLFVILRRLQIDVAHFLGSPVELLSIFLGGEAPAFDLMRPQVHAPQNLADVGRRNLLHDLAFHRFVGDFPRRPFTHGPAAEFRLLASEGNQRHDLPRGKRGRCARAGSILQTVFHQAFQWGLAPLSHGGVQRR